MSHAKRTIVTQTLIHKEMQFARLSGDDYCEEAMSHVTEAENILSALVP